VKGPTQKPGRRSIRLRDYDYAQPGAYFITVCAYQRQCLFGEIVDGEMQLNEWGRVIQACWEAIPDHFPNVELDAFVIMPNHIHGIITIVGATHASITATRAQTEIHWCHHRVIQIRRHPADQRAAGDAGRARLAAQLLRTRHPG